MSVRVSLNDEGRSFRESMRRFFTEHSPLALSRVPEGEIPGLPSYWPDLASLGLLELGVSTPAGELIDLVDVLPLYLEMGRSLAMTPHLGTAIIATHVLSLLDTSGARAELVAEISSGTRIIVPALQEDEEASLRELHFSAERTDAGWQLRGRKLFVPYVNVASHVLVPARTGEGELTTFLVDVAQLKVSYLANVSHLPLFEVDFGNVVVDDADRVGDVGGSATAWRVALDRAAVLQCAQISGAGEYLLEVCVEYAKVRHQFGVAIGVHQAVQYLCTDISIATRVTLLLAMQAAVRIDHGEPYQRELAAAKTFAKRAASITVSRAQELHAGVGFMDEFDLHLFTRRSLYWQAELGCDEEPQDELIAAYSATKGSTAS